jgi:hypothetical protein
MDLNGKKVLVWIEVADKDKGKGVLISARVPDVKRKLSLGRSERELGLHLFPN